MCAEIISRELAKDIKENEMELLAWEESATLWLWAYQELLEWNDKITWMFSPVTGKKTYPGDLWGVDERGSLVLVETKRATGQAKQDPFLDFLEYERVAKFPSGDKLFLRAKKLLTEEVKFITESRPFFDNGSLPVKFHRGVVPYSSKRSAVRRWHHLYSEEILPMLLNKDEYLTHLDRNLQKFSGRKDAIHYFGFVLTNALQANCLSKSGEESLGNLRGVAGTERVHFVQVTAQKETPDTVLLKSIRSL